MPNSQALSFYVAWRHIGPRSLASYGDVGLNLHAANESGADLSVRVRKSNMTTQLLYYFTETNCGKKTVVCQILGPCREYIKVFMFSLTLCHFIARNAKMRKN